MISETSELWGDMKMFPSGPFLTFLCKWGRMGWIDLEPSNRASLIHNEKDGSDPISKLTPYNVFCTSGYTFSILYFKIFYCNLIIKNSLLRISLTQSWKKSFLCSDTWQMFLVLNGMGIKDKLGPLVLQPPISLFSYTWFSSLFS